MRCFFNAAWFPVESIWPAKGHHDNSPWPRCIQEILCRTTLEAGHFSETLSQLPPMERIAIWNWPHSNKTWSKGRSWFHAFVMHLDHPKDSTFQSLSKMIKDYQSTKPLCPMEQPHVWDNITWARAWAFSTEFPAAKVTPFARDFKGLNKELKLRKILQPGRKCKNICWKDRYGWGWCSCLELRDFWSATGCTKGYESNLLRQWLV